MTLVEGNILLCINAHDHNYSTRNTRTAQGIWQVPEFWFPPSKQIANLNMESIAASTIEVDITGRKNHKIISEYM